MQEININDFSEFFEEVEKNISFKVARAFKIDDNQIAVYKNENAIITDLPDAVVKQDEKGTSVSERKL